MRPGPDLPIVVAASSRDDVIAYAAARHLSLDQVTWVWHAYQLRGLKKCQLCVVGIVSDDLEANIGPWARYTGSNVERTA